MGKRVAGNQQRVLERQRLFYEVIGSQLGCSDCGRDGGVTGDHDHAGRRRLFAELAKGFDAVDARQPDVEQHEIIRTGVDLLQAFLAARYGFSGVALVFEDAFQRLSDAGLVVDNEDS